VAETATQEFVHNLHELPRTVKEACFRLGKEPESEREESQATFHNLFLHIHSVRVHVRTLKPTLTFGLGLLATASFVITIITGVLLMVYYKPSTDLAYQSIKDIHFTVATGRFIRNIHRWAAHVMVLSVLLHMARVFFTGSYKKPREFNWLVGLGLLVNHDRFQHCKLAAGTHRRYWHHKILRSRRTAEALAAGGKLRRTGCTHPLLCPARLHSSLDVGHLVGRAFLENPKRWRPR
jgi:hypothetical protein